MRSHSIVAPLTAATLITLVSATCTLAGCESESTTRDYNDTHTNRNVYSPNSTGADRTQGDDFGTDNSLRGDGDHNLGNTQQSTTGQPR